MKQDTTTPMAWPPLIYGRTIPWHVRVRDIVLTVMAWAVMTWMLRYMIHLCWDYLRYPFLGMMNAKAPDWSALWLRILPYLIMSLMLIISVWIYGFLHRKQMRNRKPHAPPEALSLEEHAAIVGLDPSTIMTWRSWPVITVEHNAHDRIIGAHQGEAKTPKSS